MLCPKLAPVIQTVSWLRVRVGGSGVLVRVSVGESMAVFVEVGEEAPVGVSAGVSVFSGVFFETGVSVLVGGLSMGVKVGMEEVGLLT